MSNKEQAQQKQLKATILDHISQSKQNSVEVNELSKELKMDDSADFKVLVNTIAELEREDKIELTPQGRFKLKEQEPVLQGRFSGTDKGFGFVVIDEESKDVFIPANQTKSAFHGDTVEIEIVKDPIPWKDKSAEGKVVEIIERATTKVIGEFHAYDDDEIKKLGFYGYVVVNMKKFPEIPIQIETKGLHPVEGEIVQVEITQYPRYRGEDMLGLVKQTIGHKNEPGVEILAIVEKHGIPSVFPDEVIEEAEKVPDQITEEEIKGRKDLRGDQVVTIDGADAKDLDDAVTIEKLANGNYKLGVHIADVSYYVEEGSELDKEAFERGTSSYLTDRVIPMLPRRLSNGICSLHPNVDRLTLSCEMEIDQKGDVVNHEISPSVIRSSARMTYTAVNDILDGDQATRDEYGDFVSMFETMEELHDILEDKRHRRGAIDFDSEEAEIIVDDEGNPTDIELRERGTGERIIESFMLAANETVSEHYTKKHLPILYRVHEQPNESKVQQFLEFVTNFGVVIKGTKDSIQPKDLQEVLKKVEDKPEETVINMLLLRSMQQARYDVEPRGHYGLAAEFYSHFTSPIRRYPDLILHRLIHYYAEVGKDKRAQDYWNEKLPDIAEQSSMTERRAVDAERETDQLKKTEYMEQYVGEEFEGSIMSITSFGMFIQLPNSVEGLVHISRMDDDYYEFNDRSLTMVGTRTGKVFKIGQPITVKVSRVDVEQVEIDFEIVKDNAEVDSSKISKPKKKKKKGKKKNKPTNNKNGKDKKNSNKKNFKIRRRKK